MLKQSISSVMTPRVPNPVTFTLLSAAQSAYGTDVYRQELPSVAPLYRPTITVEAKPNSKGTNVNVNVNVKVPVLSSENVVTDTIRASASITALQTVTGEQVEIAIGALIGALSKRLVAIANGRMDLDDFTISI